MVREHLLLLWYRTSFIAVSLPISIFVYWQLLMGLINSVLKSHTLSSGEKLTDDEVDGLLSGIEDSQGQVNYEGDDSTCQKSVIENYSTSLL